MFRLLLFRAGGAAAFGGQHGSFCQAALCRHETWPEAQYRFEASPVISCLSSADPTGAQGTSRDLAGAELLVWFAWLEEFKVSVCLVTILLPSRLVQLALADVEGVKKFPMNVLEETSQ